MSIHKDILNNLNDRYVLLKRGYYYRIVDKLSRTIVVITDPFIDYKKLVRYMLDNNVEVFRSIKDLPEPIEKPIDLGIDFLTNSYEKISLVKFFTKKVYSQKGIEIGTIISALTDKMVDPDYKRKIEDKIIQYSFTHIYKDEGLKFYSDVYNDTISMIILRGINDLPSEDLSPSELNILDW